MVKEPFIKPLAWWYHKILAEYFVLMDDMPYYYHHLQQMIKLGYNNFGEKVR